jgi:hypothetical protein
MSATLSPTPILPAAGDDSFQLPYAYNPQPTWARRVLQTLTLKKRRKTWIKRLRLNHALARLARFPRNPASDKHGLPGRLVISLTSYPGRFSTLHLTLKSLLDQTVKPDQIILWIAHDDLARLPEEVRALEGPLLSVRGCEDLRNFKKIIPTLGDEPDSFILICDDDTYYPEGWLAELVSAYDPQQPSIVCTRAHRLQYTAEGRLAPYRAWQRNVADSSTALPRTDLLPTGNGGVLYPPRSLPPETLDRELLRKLSPTSDDVWLYFMARQAGWRVRRVPGRKRRFIEWPNSQAQALHAFHRGGTKDKHLQDMCRHFGVP